MRYAEPNRVRQASATMPNDPSFGQLWGLHNAADSDIDAPEAWDLSTGGDTLVAVVDEGIAYDHPDLAPNMWTNPGEIADNDVDEDHQTRWSAIWEYTPMQFLQARIGARIYDGPPENDSQNRREYFAELHGFF